MRSSLAIVCMLAAIAGACSGDPPDKEMQQAQIAIDAARAAGADRYATAEFTAAQEALTHAHEAVGERDYRLALNYALDSRERAQDAAKEAAERKATARHEADQAISGALAALNTARNRLKTAEVSKVPARALASPRNGINAADKRVQEARAAMEKGEYAGATSTASNAAADLTRYAHDLDALMPPAARRRR
jgi:hypothetical protein